MANLTWTIYPNHPRIAGFRDTDKTALTTRTNTSASWQGIWDGTITSYKNTLNGGSDAAVVSSGGGPLDRVYQHMMLLGLWGWIENDTTTHTKLLNSALLLANTPAFVAGFTDRRFQLLALGYAYDFLRTGVITFSDANRKTIGDAIITYSTANGNANEYMDGHSAGNLMAQFVANLAIAGESGSGFNYTTSAANNINEALDFWYGSSSSSPFRMETDRYFSANGGSGKGAWYQTIAMWHTFFLLQGVHSGFVRNADTPGSLLELGEAYEPWTSETWIAKHGEWWLNAYYRGNNDYLKHGDTSRIVTPWIHEYTRHSLGPLITYGGTWRKQVRWMYDQIQAYSDTLGASTAYNRIHDVVHWDPADANNASQSPTAAGTARSKCFSPDGDYFHRNTWDIPNSCMVNIRCRERFYDGHPLLDCGGISIDVKGDPVLFTAGYYSTSDTSADFGGLHNRLYYKQTIGSSGTYLVDNGQATPHTANVNGVRIPIPSGLGGQYYKKYDDGGGPIYDPPDVQTMRSQNSGLAWLMSGDNIQGDNQLRIVNEGEDEQADFDFLHAQIRRAYLLQSSDFGGFNDRVTDCQPKWLVIKNVWQWPVILQFGRVHARFATHTKRQVFHGGRAFNTTTFGTTKRFDSAGHNNIGKITIDQYVPSPSDWTHALVGGGAADPNGYTANQYAFQNGGTNYKPGQAASNRHRPELGTWTLHLQPTTTNTVHDFVVAMFPSLVGENPPSYSWIDEPFFYGLSFGPNKEFRVHKSLVFAQGTSDTTAPDAPVGVTAIPGTVLGSILAGCSPNGETDMDHYNVYYRVKV